MAASNEPNQRSNALLGRLLQSHARPSTVLVDERDAGVLKRTLDYFEGGTAGLAGSGLKLVNGHNSNPRSFS